VAVAGGVVNEPACWQMLCDEATVVWLKARPEDHWDRVVSQGDRRPMAGQPAAMAELVTLWRTRAATYASAGLTVETTSRTPESIAQEIVARLATAANEVDSPQP
jgi:XRE family aerobic/anaerobic benzoate catabolism transcriptional regulator